MEKSIIDDNNIMKFGKYTGLHIKKVPAAYLEWCVAERILDKKDFPKELISIPSSLL